MALPHLSLRRDSQWRSRYVDHGAGSVTAHLETIDMKLHLLLSLRDSAEDLLSLPAKVDQLLELMPTVQALKVTLNEVQISIDFLSAKYDLTLASATPNEKSVKDIQDETTATRVSVQEQCSTIKQLQKDLNELDQHGRHQNLEIQGLPYSPTENVAAFTNVLAAKLGVPVPQPSDVLAIYPLPVEGNAQPVILKRFASAGLWNRWLSAHGSLRSSRESGTVEKLFCNENLTTTNKELFCRATSKGRE